MTTPEILPPAAKVLKELPDADRAGVIEAARWAARATVSRTGDRWGDDEREAVLAAVETQSRRLGLRGTTEADVSADLPDDGAMDQPWDPAGVISRIPNSRPGARDLQLPPKDRE